MADYDEQFRQIMTHDIVIDPAVSRHFHPTDFEIAIGIPDSRSCAEFAVLAAPVLRAYDITDPASVDAVYAASLANLVERET